MAKDFSAFLGPKKKKNLDLLGINDPKTTVQSSETKGKASKNLVQTEDKLETSNKQSSSKVVAKPTAERTHNPDVSQRKRRESKRAGNRQPLDSKATVSQPSPNRELTVSQPSPNRELTVSQPLVENHQKNRYPPQPLATPLADPSPNRELTVSQPLVETLTGKKRIFIFWLFQIRHSTGHEDTGPVDNKILFELLGNRSTGALRNLLNQLKASGYVSIYPLARGRIGLRKFKLNDSIYKEILALPEEVKSLTVSQPSPNRELTVSQPLARALVSPSSSSSYSNIKSTSTNDELWKTINLSQVEQMGINESAIFEARQKFGPFDFIEFEKFLERFEKYMGDSKKSRSISNARGFFFSLCKQIGEGIEPLSEIETDQDIALKELLVQKRLAKKEREEIQRELMEFEFEEWFERLSIEEKAKLAPKNDLVKEGSAPYKAVFRGYFEENLWDKKNQLVVKR